MARTIEDWRKSGSTEPYDMWAKEEEVLPFAGELTQEQLRPKSLTEAINSGNPNINQASDIKTKIDSTTDSTISNRDGSTSYTDDANALITKAQGMITTKAPETTDTAKLREGLMTGVEAGGAYKMDDLKTEAASVKSTIDDFTRKLKTSMGFEENQAVPLSVIAGRNQQAYNEYKKNVEFFQTRYDNIQTQIKDRLDGINQYISDKQMDYTNAKNSYENDYKRAWDAITHVDEELDEEKQLQRDAQKDAAAQWTIYSNLIKDGVMDYSKLTDDQKLKINELEVRAGYIPGTMSMVKSDNPNGKLIGQATNNAGDVSFIFQQPDGSIKTTVVKGAGATKTSSGSDSTLVKFTPADIQKLVGYGMKRSEISGILNRINGGESIDNLGLSYEQSVVVKNAMNVKTVDADALETDINMKINKLKKDEGLEGADLIREIDIEFGKKIENLWKEKGSDDPVKSKYLMLNKIILGGK